MPLRYGMLQPVTDQELHNQGNMIIATRLAASAVLRYALPVVFLTWCSEAALDNLKQGASSLLGKSTTLPAGILQTTRLRDGNQQDPSNAAIQSLEFHPNGDMLLTAGLDKNLKFFQVWPS